MKYSVDQRVGCIAIIDNIISAPSNGLHRDDAHVVKYWHGYWLPNLNLNKQIENCDGNWRVAKFIIKRAEKLCQKLNTEET